MPTQVAKYRRYYNYTQVEMAELIGVSSVTYSNKELGKVEFKASEMFIISNKFGKTVDEIFLPEDFTLHEVK